MKKFLLCSLFMLFAINIYALSASDTYRTGGMITDTHDKIHKHEFYQYSHIFTDIADNASAYFLIDATSATFTNMAQEAHIYFNVASEGNAEIFLYANPTTASSGTYISGYDLNWTDTIRRPYLPVSYGANIKTTGTTKMSRVLPGGNMNFGSGGSFGSSSEFEIDAGSSAIVGIYNRGGAAKSVSITLEIYEIIK